MINKERLKKIYKVMNDIRNFEQKAYSLFENNKLRGSVHLYTGQEAVAATVCSHLRDEDYITSTHRGHGHCIAKGADLKKSMAELMGKETGYCRGRSGSMHIADFEKGNLGANAVVAGGIAIAVGAALSAKMKGTDRIAVSFFGDGASNEGVCHEAMNLASVWKLPIIFICENNLYGMSTHVDTSTSVQDISVRAAGYNMPGYTVDGNDVFEIDKAVTKAIKRVKNGEGPVLIECKTYRWMGHWTGDPQNYRTREELESIRNECPIQKLRGYVLNNAIFSEEELNEIEAESLNAIEEAAQFAMESPEPDPAKVLDDVFFEN